MPNKSSKNGSARFWPTPQANKTTESGEIVNADGTPWDGISKPHGAATGRPITTALADAIRHSTPTSSPSTEPTTPGLTCSQGDFLANLSASPGSDSARQMTVRSGRKCCELLTRQDPLGSLVKMLLESSRWNSTISYLTWKASATPRGRLLFRLVPSMPDTEETECGLSGEGMWATPNTMDTLPPKSEEALHREATVTRPGRSKPANLRDQVSNMKMWPTPTVDEASNVTRTSGAFQSLTRSVQESVKMWPTPATRDYKGERGEAAQQRKGNPQDTLPNAVKMWHTPTSNEDAAGTPAGKMQAMLGNHPAIRGVTPEEWQRGSLNPNWVEWLMGYPKEWTVAESFASGRTKTSARQESAPESNIAPTDCVG